MSFEMPASSEEFATPDEVNEMIKYIHNWLAEVSAMGGNDSEVPTANRFLNELLLWNPIKKSRLESMRRELGRPGDKSSNYH